MSNLTTNAAFTPVVVAAGGGSGSSGCLGMAPGGSSEAAVPKGMGKGKSKKGAPNLEFPKLAKVTKAKKVHLISIQGFVLRTIQNPQSCATQMALAKGEGSGRCQRGSAVDDAKGG